MKFYYCFIDNNPNSTDKFLARGFDSRKITRELIKMSQKERFNFSEYRFHHRKDGAVTIFKRTYSYNQTSKSKKQSRITSNFIYIPKSRESELLEILNKRQAL